MRTISLGICALGLLACGLAGAPATVASTDYALRGYGEFSRVDKPGTQAGVDVHEFTFADAAHAVIFVSKLYSDYELSRGNTVAVLDTGSGPVDAIGLGDAGAILPLLVRDSRTALVLVGRDRAALQAEANKQLHGTPLRRAELSHPLYMDKWDRYPLGVWQFISDYEQDDQRKTPDSFYEWMGKIGLNPQINMGNVGVDLASSDNPFTWLRHYFAKYGVKFQHVQWLEHDADLYNRNPYLSVALNPHVMLRSSYYGELRDAPGLLRDVQNATFLNTLKRLDDDPNQMAILDPNGEIGPFDFVFWGASGPAHQRNFVHYLRDVRGFSLQDVSRRYHGKPGFYKQWGDVDLADWRTFYGWTNGAVDFAGEWRVMPDDKEEGFAQRWAAPEFNDADWVRLYYPGDTTLYSLTGRGKPLWMRRKLTVDPASFPNRIYLSVAPLSYKTVQVFLNGTLLGAIDPRFGTSHVAGQFDVTDAVRANPVITLALRFAIGDAPSGPVFLTPKAMEDFPTGDPQLNARRFDHMDYVNWAAADTVRTTLLGIRSIDPNRPIKVHAFEASPWGWKVLDELGGYSHHTGAGAGWSYTVPKQYGLARNLQDSAETGGPMENLHDLKGLFGNLVFMGKNAHDYFMNLQEITHDPAMRAWFEAKIPFIKVMGRANVNAASMAAIRGTVNVQYSWEFAPEVDWRYGLELGRGGEMTPLLDEVRIREGHLPYRAIVDEGTPCWDAEMASALKEYVQAGGILVLNGMSGIHTFTERWKGPGPALAGVGVTPAATTYKSITMTGSDPIIFSGTAKSIGVGSRPEGPTMSIVPQPGTETLAIYPDGTPALTRRQLGKGAVYFIGVTTYPGELIRSLVERLGNEVYATADKEGVDELRTLRTNNGSEDLLMLRGRGKSAAVRWTFDYTPAGIYEPVTGAPIDARIEGKTATFTVNIPDWDFAWFAARRPDAGDQFAHWLQRQSEIWHGLVKNAVAPNPPLFRHLDLNHDWKLVQTDSVEKAMELMKLDDQAAGLQPTELLLWNTPGMNVKSGKGVVGLYRRDFTVPPGWEKGNTLTLAIRGQVYDSTLHGFFGPSTIFLNGTQIWTGNRLDSAFLDITANVKAGSNRLEVVHEGNGLMSSFTVIRTPQADQTVDLAGTWQAVDGLNEVRQVTLPGEVETSFVYREITVPREQAGKEVWLRVEGAGTVIVNGRTRYWELGSGTTYPEPAAYEVNITPDIRFGETNRIVLANGAMLNGWQKTRLNFKRIELSYYSPGKWDGNPKGIRGALTPPELADVTRLAHLVKLYPLVNAPISRPPLPDLCSAGAAASYTPPPAVLDLDLSPVSGLVDDRSANHIPVVGKGDVTPFSEKDGHLRGLYLHAESLHPGYLQMPPTVIRKKLESKPFTICAWVKPIAITASGGSLVNWCSYIFDWGIHDKDLTVEVQARPERQLIANSVVNQREWQFLTFALDGTNGAVYVNGIAVGTQHWPVPMPGVDVPLTIGCISGEREFLNAKLAGFTIYEGALKADEVARLYVKEQPPFITDAATEWPEEDLFRLHVTPAGVSDSSEVPGDIKLGPGARPAMDNGQAVVALSGTDSCLIINEHRRVHLLHEPFSLVMDIRPAQGASGMLFRRHHELCLSLGKDGSVVLDANIGRNDMLKFPKVVTFGQWNRLMLTYDGKVAALFHDGKLVARENYPGALCGGKYPLSFGGDNTLTPIGNLIAMDLRELRFIPRVLESVPPPEKPGQSQ